MIVSLTIIKMWLRKLKENTENLYIIQLRLLGSKILDKILIILIGYDTDH